MISRLAAAAYPKRKQFMIAWALVMALALVFTLVNPPDLKAEITDAPGSESAQVTEQLRALHATKVFVIAIVDAPPTDKKAVDSTNKAIAYVSKMDGVFAAVAYVDGVPELERFVSDDATKFAAVAIMDGSLSSEEMDKASEPVVARLNAIEGADVTVGGDAYVGSAITKIAEKDAKRSELIATPIALLALILLLGGWRVGAVPLIAAGSAILLTTVAFVFAETFTPLSTFAMSITSLFGIGLGIDYGLLLVARFREELAAGNDPAHAVSNTTNTAGRTVIFSAATVAISMAGLLFLPGSMNRSFALAGIFVTLLVAVVSVVFIPPLLGVMWHRVTPKGADDGDGWFGQVARRVQKRPAAVVAGVTLIFLMLASPILGMKTSLIDEKFLPPGSGVRESAETLAAEFSELSANPIQVVATTFNDDPKVAPFIGEIAAMEGVKSAEVRPNLSGSDIPVVIEVVPVGQSQSDTAKHLVHKIRALDPGFEVRVGGRAAVFIDTQNAVNSSIPFAAAWLIGATFILLFLMTGSVFIPLKAIAMNVLALSATFGVVVAVFQNGLFAGAMGIDPPGFIEIYVPIQVIMFAFGLSMDYEVFLLSRIKEVYDHTGDNDLAVAEGIQKTGRVITSAAVLICVVFAAAMFGDLLSMKQFVFALGLAIILDATIIRTLLVPATMTLMGDRNWWAPAPLRRFHDRYGISEHAKVEPTGTMDASDQTSSDEPGTRSDDDYTLAVPVVAAPVTVGPTALTTPMSQVPALTPANSADQTCAPGDEDSIWAPPPAMSEGDIWDSADDDPWDDRHDTDGPAVGATEVSVGAGPTIDEIGVSEAAPGAAASDEYLTDLDDLDGVDWEDDLLGAEMADLDRHLDDVFADFPETATGSGPAPVTNEESDLIDWFRNGVPNGVPAPSSFDQVTGSVAVIESVQRSLASPKAIFEVDPKIRVELGVERSTPFVDVVTRLSTVRPNDDLLLRARGRKVNEDGVGYRDIFVILDAKARRIGRISGL